MLVVERHFVEFVNFDKIGGERGGRGWEAIRQFLLILTKLRERGGASAWKAFRLICQIQRNYERRGGWGRIRRHFVNFDEIGGEGGGG